MGENMSYKPFEILKDYYKVQRTESPEHNTNNKTTHISKSNNPTTDSLNNDVYFKQAMEKVREIKEFRALPFKQKKLTPGRTRTSNPDKEAYEELCRLVSGYGTIDIKNTQEFIYWYNPAYTKTTGNNLLEKLHEGRFSVQDYLDLHGCFLPEARSLTHQFLKHSRRRGFGCVKIIHGRGLRSPAGPLIKNALTKWLTGFLSKYIHAFVTAKQVDGGAGATYILLKK